MDYKPFSGIDLDNSFFDSLKADYKEFETWFKKKQTDGSKAYIEIDKSTNKMAVSYTHLTLPTICSV